MNTSACRKTRALQWQRNRFESRKNLTLEQCGSARSMRCFIEHHPRSYQIYTAQMTNMKGILLGLQPERRAIIHCVIESFAQYASNGRYP
jgi:hypothetical protein